MRSPLSWSVSGRRSLRNSEEKFSKAFEASPTIITIIRIKDRRYLEVNRAFEQQPGSCATKFWADR